MAGLTAGNRLRGSGWQVTLLDKGRTCGGRMSTRRFGGGVFDSGAQFFTVRDGRFRAEAESWFAAGIAREWFIQEGHSRYRGEAGMNGIPQYLARELDIRVSEHVERVAGGRVETRTGNFQADAVILTAPVEQSVALGGEALPRDVREKLAAVEYEPCFAAMALLEHRSSIPAPGYVRPPSGAIAWVADNQQKGISAVPAVTIHASPEFTRAHWDAAREEVGGLLVKEAGLKGVRQVEVHRWKYSMLAQTLPAACVLVPGDVPLVFAGDAFGGPRVEGAYLSGLAAAEALAEYFGHGGEQSA